MTYATIFVAAGVLLLLITGVLVFVLKRPKARCVAWAPKDSTKDMCIMFTDIQVPGVRIWVHGCCGGGGLSIGGWGTGGATPLVLGRQLPPPPRGLRPTVSCQRCRPQASMGA